MIGIAQELPLSIRGADLSRMAYGWPTGDLRPLPSCDIVRVRHNFNDETTDTQGFVAEDANLIYVVFRGTSSLKDWLTDLDAVMVDSTPLTGSNRPMHRGLFNGTMAVKDSAGAAVLKLLREKPRPVGAFGHSMGGGHAAVAPAWLSPLGAAYPLVRTYEAMRPGGEDLARFLRLVAPDVIRWTFGDDLVPRHPSVLIGGVQPWPAHHLIAGGWLDLRNDQTELPGPRAILDLFDGESIRDHAIGNVLGALQALRVRLGGPIR